MRFVDALALELKKVAFRGVRMSRAQRRRAATARQPMYLAETSGDRVGKNVRSTNLNSAPNSLRGYVGDAAAAYSGRYGTTSRDLSGPLAPAARVNSRSSKATAKRLAAAHSGSAKPSGRMKSIQKTRKDLVSARQRARTFINSNARRSTRDLGLF